MNNSNTILHPPWLNIARALWLIAAGLCVVIAVIGTIQFMNSPLPDCTTPEQATTACGPWILTRQDSGMLNAMGISPELIAALFAFQSTFPKAIFLAVGLLIFWKKSDDWMALLLSFMLVGFVIEGVTEVGTLTPFALFLYQIITVIFGLLPFIFPNGRFVPRWMVWLALPVVVAQVVVVNLPSFGIATSDQVYILSLMGAFGVWFLLAGYSAVYRYRRVSNAVERQQTKWVVAGILGTFLLFIPFTIIGIWFPPSQPSRERLAFYFFFFVPVYYVAYLFMPVATMISILRYRLWDIDLLIRRTVSYALIVALLAIVYFGSVILLQRVFAGIIGESTEIITVLSTLAIAALFVPLRNKIQDAIDKRFNRKKYNAQQVMEKFAQTVRDETDIDKLTAELVNVVQETMQPKSVSLWLKKEERGNKK